MCSQTYGLTKTRLFAAGLLIACSATMSKASSLLGYYTFDNSANLGQDSSGNGNDLTVSSSGATYDASAKIGSGALSLDGSAGVLTGNASKLCPAITTGYSLSFWVQTTDTTSANNGKNISRPSAGGINASAGGNPTTTYRGGVNSGTSINTGVAESDVWQLIVISYTASGGTVNTYVNGTAHGTPATGQTYAAGSGVNGFAIGAQGGSTAGVGIANTYFFGNLDDFAIYSEPLTQAQSMALYNQTVTPATVDTVPEPALLSFFGVGGLLMLRRRRASR
jgi:hypothetical protein